MQLLVHFDVVHDVWCVSRVIHHVLFSIAYYCCCCCCCCCCIVVSGVMGDCEYYDMPSKPGILVYLM